MMREGADSLSVRAVAQRAGVGASTLRYYFPTQRALLDTVLTNVYTDALPDERIRDSSVPPKERLIECLGHLLDPAEGEVDAREAWNQIFQTFIAPDATDAARAGYAVLTRQVEQRVESWLAILDAEGALPPGDNARRTHFLLTLLDGLSLERALPSKTSRLEDEAATLAMAVDAVFATAAALAGGVSATPASD